MRILDSIFSYMKHIKERVSNMYLMFICFILCSGMAHADIQNLASNVNTQIKSVAEQVLKVLNTVIASIGVIYVIIVGLIFIFKPDTFKENSKILIGALVALGALYGITAMGLNAFN